MDFADAARSLANTQFLPQAYEGTFIEMCAECERLADTHQPLRLPPSTAPYAFAKVFEIWEILNKQFEARERTEAEKKASEPPKYTGPSWSEFLQTREAILQLRRQNSITDLEVTWAGVERGDLDSRTVDNPEIRRKYGFSPREDWQEVSYRLSQALHKLRYITPLEKEIVPYVMAFRAEHQTTNQIIGPLQRALQNSKTFYKSD